MISGRGHKPYSYALTAAIAAALSSSVYAGRVLFDATKSEMAGNADWVIDSDSELSGQSNPQRIPTPAQSGITASTPETYWKGAISAWGVTMVKHGNTVESLPRVGGRITYGDATNAQDLSHYKTYVVCEPNNLFTLAEKTAIVNFVANGGGLYLVSDHDVADRDGDGKDAVAVWNDLFTNNGVASNPFGLAAATGVFGTAGNFNEVSTNLNAAAPFKTGIEGTAANLEFNNGTSFTISTAANSTVAAAVWRNGSQTTSNVMMAYATYGLGRVVALGDSSPADDGTGDTGDNLFTGWSTGTNGVLIANGTDWLGASAQTSYDSAKGGSWANAAAWTGVVPNSDAAIVDFTNNLTAAATVTLDQNRSVGVVRFNSDQSYTIAGPSMITFGSSPPLIGTLAGVVVTKGSHTITAPMTAPFRGAINVVPATSTLTIGSLFLPSNGGFSKDGLGTLKLQRVDGIAPLSVSAGTMQFTGDATTTASRLGSLSIKAGATVDLGRGALVVDYTGTSSPLSALKTYLLSTQLRTSASGLAVGYGEASALGLTSFVGTSVDSTAVVMRATYAGDANLDLTVNFDDLIRLAQHYNASGVWTDGDFDYTGNVNFDDLILLAQHYNATVPASLGGFDAAFEDDWALAQALVPEPGMILTGLIAMSFLRRRR